MLEVARTENSDSKIRYIHMPMEEIAQLQETFDVVVSSLAFHYVEDFRGVIRDVHNLLEEKGVLISRKKIHYAHAIRAATDGRRMKMEIKCI